MAAKLMFKIFPGPIAIIISSLMTTITLINACHHCGIQVYKIKPHFCVTISLVTVNTAFTENQIDHKHRKAYILDWRQPEASFCEARSFTAN